MAGAIASLEPAPGIHFSCDAGIAGLHPSQAIAACAPALAFHVFVAIPKSA